MIEKGEGEKCVVERVLQDEEEDDQEGEGLIEREGGD